MADQRPPSASEDQVRRTRINFDAENIANTQDRSEEKVPEDAVPVSIPRFRVETRPFTHKYYVRRPRALQYFQDGRFVESSGISRNASNEAQAEGGDAPPVLWLNRKQRVATAKIPLPQNADADSRTSDVPVIQRRKL